MTLIYLILRFNFIKHKLFTSSRKIMACELLVFMDFKKFFIKFKLIKV